MLGIHSFNSILTNATLFYEKVNYDSSSLLYHTRVFDTMLLETIGEHFLNYGLDFTFLFFSSIYFNAYLFFDGSLNLMFSVFRDLFISLDSSFFLTLNFLQINLFDPYLESILFNSLIAIVNLDYFLYFIDQFILVSQKYEFFLLLSSYLNIFSD